MLNVQTEHLENHTARLTVEVEPERIENAMKDAARRIAKKGRIPGFRPGKAPLNLVMNMYGRDYILSEAIDSLGNDIYREVLEAAQIEPYAPGSLEKIDQEDGLKLVFVVPKRPEVDLGDYRSIRVPFVVPDVTDDMVNEAMEEFRERQALLEPVERPAQMGDQVTLSHIEVIVLSSEEDEEDDDDDENEAGEDEIDDADDDDDEDDDDDDDDDEDEDGDRVLIHQHDYDRVLREDEKDLLPGFSAELVGLNVGDEKTFRLNVPEDYDLEEVAGRTVECNVHVGKVQSRLLPEWSDTLAEQIAQNETVKTMLELRVQTRQQLAETTERIANQALIEEAMEQLVEGATIHYPEELVQEYLDDVLQEIDNNMRRQGMTLADFLKITGRKDEELREQYRERAVWRAERALALGELVHQEQLAVSSDEINAEIDHVSELLGGSESARFKQFLMTDESRLDIANRMISDRALSRLAAIAKGEDPSVGTPAPDAEPAADADEAEAAASEPVEEAAGTDEAEAAEPNQTTE